jgi:hypothetical protein
MRKNSTWLGVAIIAILIIGSGIATIFAPSLVATFNNTMAQLTPGSASAPSAPANNEPETVAIDIPGMFYTVGQDMVTYIPGASDLNGSEVSSALIVGVLLVVITVLVFVVSLPLGLIVVMGARSTTTLQADAGYQQAVQNLENNEKAFVKERLSNQPPNGKPSGVMPRWSAISTTLVLMALSYFGGVVFGSAIGANPVTWGQLFAIVALIICLLTIRPQKILQVDDTMNARPPWSSLWVLFSGALVVGLGLGAMYAVMTGNNPFVFLSWEWFEANVLALLA